MVNACENVEFTCEGEQISHNLLQHNPNPTPLHIED